MFLHSGNVGIPCPQLNEWEGLVERESPDLKELNVPPFWQCLNSKPQLNEWEGLVERESPDLKELNVPPFWQ